MVVGRQEPQKTSRGHGCAIGKIIPDDFRPGGVTGFPAPCRLGDVSDGRPLLARQAG